MPNTSLFHTTYGPAKLLWWIQCSNQEVMMNGVVWLNPNENILPYEVEEEQVVILFS